MFKSLQKKVQGFIKRTSGAAESIGLGAATETQFKTFSIEDGQVHFYGTFQREENEEEKKEFDSDDEYNDMSNDIAQTSNLAFDRYLSIGALGYSNGMIRLMRVNSLRDEVSVENAGKQREAQIIEASDCEIL